MHKVAVLAFDGVVPFDLSIPCAVFSTTQLRNGRAAYDVIVCGIRRKVRTDFFDIHVTHGIAEALGADTIIVPGVVNLSIKFPKTILTLLREAAKRKIRIASICSGTFLLAEAGILNGMMATTHWMAARELEQRFPLIDVDPSVLYIDNGLVLTSAGAAAGLDLCLHMVRLDYGAEVGAYAAKISVMPLERLGGQSQFIVHPTPSVDGESLDPVLRWLDKNCHRPLALKDIALKAQMSTRTLSRKFFEQTGTTPLQQMLQLRVRRGQRLLETTDLSIDVISEKVGFGSSLSFRVHFQKHVEAGPKDYRLSFKTKSR